MIIATRLFICLQSLGLKQPPGSRWWWNRCSIDSSDSYSISMSTGPIKSGGCNGHGCKFVLLFSPTDCCIPSLLSTFCVLLKLLRKLRFDWLSFATRNGEILTANGIVRVEFVWTLLLSFCTRYLSSFCRSDGCGRVVSLTHSCCNVWSFNIIDGLCAILFNEKKRNRKYRDGD